ncbi:MAG TPA: ABC-F family ATP-binding cassette domain-containing protein [Planctomycetota bacterium]|nr:ABC-F family ATP-binding cassette domain-containing protein [Planctomycetota bacterium]
MSVVAFEDVGKRFGSRDLFLGVSFAIEDGEKLGLIGRNGTGKTTILRMITGDETPEVGAVHRRSDLRIGVVEQSPKFRDGMTLHDEAMSGLDELRRLETEMHEIGDALAHTTDETKHAKLLRRLDEVQHRIDFLGGYDYTHRVETVLDGLEFARARWEVAAERLSGGEKNRLALAKVLVAGFDLLLLDEPTNHVDYRGVEWLEQFLHDYRGAVLAVSHDRRFLDATVTAILDLDHGRLVRYDGNYSASREQKALLDETLRRQAANQQAFVDREMDFIRRNMGSQRTAEAKGRLKRLQRLERIEGPRIETRAPKIRFAGGRGGEIAFDARDLEFHYGERVIFRHLDCTLQRGERLAVLGPNGAGKSTFLKCLVGKLKPTGGFLKLGSNAKPGYYDQELSGLDDSRTILAEVHRIRLDLTEEQIRDHLGRFLFSGDDVDKEIASLSGGERARVLLAKMVLTDFTFLILDEPTNHLDLRAREALEEALDGFPGALVVVSHDRAFLDNVCERVLEIEDGKARLFPGAYAEYAERKRRERDEAERSAREREKREREDAEKKARKQAEAARPKEKEKEKEKAPAAASSKPAEAKPARASGGRKNSFRAQKLEQQIAELEAKVKESEEAMTREENYRDAARMRELQTQHAELTREIAYLYDEWAQYA